MEKKIKRVNEIKIVHEEYRKIYWRMFDRTSGQEALFKMTKWLSLPFIYPLVWVVRLGPDVMFRICSEILSLIPTFLGYRPRHEFYKRTLQSCGNELLTWFGVVFTHREINIGNFVTIGRNSTLYHCDIGDNVMLGENVEILAGTKYHLYDRTDIPMNRQGGMLKRVKIGNDVFIGSKAIIMADIGDGAVVGAGAVVTKKVEPFTIVAGNPASMIKNRK
jgi:acetyltransferase-like isoleucine patch superfamily enzyme